MLTLLLSLALQAMPLPRMVDIPAGTFWIWDEAPRREVKVDAFRMSATEITNAQYEAFDPTHQRGAQGFSTGDDEAVIMVSWDDAMAYCRWLSGQTGKHYRLPTEEEWEYACRAGTSTAYNTGDTFPESQWKVQRNTRDKEPVSLQVAQFESNAWGLYDMHGNVEEWCYDHYGDSEFRVVRGGSHNTPVRYLRSANRSGSVQADRSVLLGFRVVESNQGPDVIGGPLLSDGRTRGRWGRPAHARLSMPTTISRPSRGCLAANCWPSGFRPTPRPGARWSCCNPPSRTGNGPRPGCSAKSRTGI